LKDYSRDSDEIHPALLATLQECVFLPQLEDRFLTELAGIGNQGILISTTLRFLYGLRPDFVATIPLLDRWMRIRVDEREKAHWQQLARAWRIMRESAFIDDPNAKVQYVAALDKALKETDIWKLPIALDLLGIQGGLTDSQIAPVFARYAEHATYLHEQLFARICCWLSSDLNDSTRHAVVKAAESAMLPRDEVPWSRTTGEQPNPWADLLLPIIQWAFSGKSSASAEGVFLRGIAGIFAYLPSGHSIPRRSLVELFSELAPLLNKTPPQILAKVLRRGAETPDPSVAAFCKLIEAFAIDPAGDAQRRH
jgi:hypothetical protein